MLHRDLNTFKDSSNSSCVLLDIILQGNTLPIFVVVLHCQMDYRLVIYSGEPHIRIFLIKNIQLLNEKVPIERCFHHLNRAA